MLKSLSLKLDKDSLHFFLNEEQFPLYTRAIRFCLHNEPMVRTAIRSITLNIFKVTDQQLEALIIQPTIQYFYNLAQYMLELWGRMDTTLPHCTHNDFSRLQDLMSDNIDFLLYLQDIFDNAPNNLCNIL